MARKNKKPRGHRRMEAEEAYRGPSMQFTRKTNRRAKRKR